jgi:hypothetical protein
MSKKTCSRCGKAITIDDSTSIIGVSVVIYVMDNPVMQEFVDTQLGKYKGQNEHHFCYECWLDSLYGK